MQYNKAPKPKVNKRSHSVPSPQGQHRLLKPVWLKVCAIKLTFFSYVPVFDSSPNFFLSKVT